MNRRARINREKRNNDEHSRSHYREYHRVRSHVENEAWRKKGQKSRGRHEDGQEEGRGTAKRKSKSQREAGGTKKEIVLELRRRKDGATIADIANATPWQNHSIRGFIKA